MSFLPRCSRFGGALLVAAAMAPGHAAPPVSASPSHIEILRRIPVELLDYSGSPPIADGPADQPPASSDAATLQLGGTMKLAIAAAHGDTAAADDSWSAIDAILARQTKNGDYGGRPLSAAFALCELTRTVLAIQRSPLAAHFKDRVNALEPAVTKSAEWLSKQRGRMLFEDGANADRLFAEAEAFFFCGRLLGDEALLKMGREFLDKGMKLYRPADGVFLKNNGPDLNYEAISLVRLQEIVLYFPDRPAEESVAKGAQWELAHIGADGAVHTDRKPHNFLGSKLLMDREKPVDYAELGLALLYYHERTGDAATLAAVQRLHQHYAEKH